MEEPAKFSFDTRALYGFVIAVVGLVIPALLIGYLVTKGQDNANKAWSPAEITAAAGLFTSIVGTLVGAFLGVQVGAAGKQQADNRAAAAESKAQKAISLLPDEKKAMFNF